MSRILGASDARQSRATGEQMAQDPAAFRHARLAVGETGEQRAVEVARRQRLMLAHSAPSRPLAPDGIAVVG